MKPLRYLLIVLFVITLAFTNFSSAKALTSSLVEVTGFGDNPSNLRMFVYIPTTVKPNPPILVVVHWCTGSAEAIHAGTQYAALADQYGYMIVYPSATRSGACFDVSTPQALTRGGGSDPVSILSMVTYAAQHYNGDLNQVYVTGISSGAMMTNVLLGLYPDIFKAGAAFAGVPFGCFATTDGSLWNSTCSSGQLIKTPQEWGDLVRNAYPGYSGPRPRMQLWHGTEDTALHYNNFGEAIKQWTNVLGASQTPVSTDHPRANWTRTRYADNTGQVVVEAISEQGVTHSIQVDEAAALHFFGLDGNGTPTATTTATTPVATTPVPTTAVPTTPGAGGCRVSYTANSWSTGFTADIKITNDSSSPIGGWALTYSYANGQQITSAWNATVSQSGANVSASNPSGHWNGTIPANGGSVSFGVQGLHNSANNTPTNFALNGVACNGGTVVPTTAAPTTAVPTTAAPTTSIPPTTAAPTTPVATTPVPTTAVPTTPGAGGCRVSYTANSWSTGFTADIKITNDSSSPIGGWALTYSYANGQQITSAWNATVSQSGANVSASNPSGHWNGTIPANGGSVSFGVQGLHNGANNTPTNFALNGVACNGGTVVPTTAATPTLVTTATPWPSLTPTNASDPDTALYVGRFTSGDPAGPRSAWSATTIKANFTGTGISAGLYSSGDNWYNVIIDGIVMAPVHIPSGTSGPVTLASGLAAGNHSLEFVRRTEAWVGDVQFSGFTATGGQLLAAPTPAARRIEFIGDSITAGYGNEGDSQYQSFTTQNENAYLAYGPVTARALGADQFTIAWSGKGVIRNYGGDTTDVLPSIYRRILPYDTATLWDAGQWIPHVVVINLGTNDFSVGVPDETAFTTAYIDFVAQIRSQYPAAHIYCALGPMLSGSNLISARDYITTVVDHFTATGDTAVHFIEFPTQDGLLGYGEDWHPSVAQHAAMATQLINRLKADLGW